MGLFSKKPPVVESGLGQIINGFATIIVLYGLAIGAGAMAVLGGIGWLIYKAFS